MSDDDRAAVRTYVPSSQRERWREEADRMGMSQSEFVRTMVQAGRRGFDLGSGESSNPVESGPPDVTPGGNGLRERVLETLNSQGPLDWDGLVDALAGDFEDRVESTLDELQSANEVKYSGRRGGYVVDDGR
jgi:hypothetical protein